MDTFWIEAGAMSGGSRNQVEFDEVLASWFVVELPALRASTEIMIDVGAEWKPCGIAHKLTTMKVDIYRLSLPTVARGGFDYPGQILAFTRQGPTGSRYFQLAVLDPAAPGALALLHGSTANGTVSTTGGSRRYGYL